MHLGGRWVRLVERRARRFASRPLSDATQFATAVATTGLVSFVRISIQQEANLIKGRPYIHVYVNQAGPVEEYCRTGPIAESGAVVGGVAAAVVPAASASSSDGGSP
jgi:hypothetical protein